jgi:predicted phage tail protein
MAIRNIKLYGHLGRQFGKQHQFDISTPTEALRALKVNFPDFEKALRDHKAGYHVFVGFDDIDTSQLSNPFGGEVVRIVPAVVGSGAEIGTFIWDAIAYAVDAYTSSALVAFAVNMIAFATASSLLSSSPKAGASSSQPSNLASYSFNGAVNTAAQGNPVPVGYGMLLVGSQVISAGLAVDQI